MLMRNRPAYINRLVADHADPSSAIEADHALAIIMFSKIVFFFIFWIIYLVASFISRRRFCQNLTNINSKITISQRFQSSKWPFREIKSPSSATFINTKAQYGGSSNYILVGQREGVSASHILAARNFVHFMAELFSVTVCSFQTQIIFIQFWYIQSDISESSEPRGAINLIDKLLSILAV